MNTHLTDIWKDCVIGKMDEKPFETWTECDSQLIGTLHADLIGLTTPQAQWMHAKFSLIIHDNCSIFGFVFNLTHKDQTMKTIMDMDVKCTGGTGVIFKHRLPIHPWISIFHPTIIIRTAFNT